MGKDLLDDRFGRFWEVPLELARRGHEVQGIFFQLPDTSYGIVLLRLQRADVAQSESIEARFTRSAKLFALRAAALNGFSGRNGLCLFGCVFTPFSVVM